jgi:hypothetical protein
LNLNILDVVDWDYFVRMKMISLFSLMYWELIYRMIMYKFYNSIQKSKFTIWYWMIWSTSFMNFYFISFIFLSFFLFCILLNIMKLNEFVCSMFTIYWNFLSFSIFSFSYFILIMDYDSVFINKLWEIDEFEWLICFDFDFNF